MVEDADYEFIPRKSIDEMKLQIGDLQKQLQQKDKISADSFNETVNKLTHTMEEMNALFRAATEQLKLEEEGGGSLPEQLSPIHDRLDEIEEQNKKIADAMLALADMIEEVKRQVKSSSSDYDFSRTQLDMQVPYPTPPQPIPLQQIPQQNLPPGVNFQQQIPPMQQNMIKPQVPDLNYPSNDFAGDLDAEPSFPEAPRPIAPLPPPPAPEKKKGLFSFKK